MLFKKVNNLKKILISYIKFTLEAVITFTADEIVINIGLCRIALIFFKAKHKHTKNMCEKKVSKQMID